MPFQIKTYTLKQLLEAHDRETILIKKHYKQEVMLGAMTELNKQKRLAERRAIRILIVEVGKKKTTNINLAQMELFR